ncbi:hypothetical protein [Streptomyces sp. ODS28]|uniref:hypothetical protein n=1 Tax=Streptomyces sp. ODS28 TaxID=3136688 RepID=UPI0031EC25D1
MTDLHAMPERPAHAVPERPSSAARRLAASDAHRLTLQSKLTEFGIPPAPEDRGALRQLAELDDVSVDAVIRWLTCAAELAARASRVRAGVYGAGTAAEGAAAPAPAPERRARATAEPPRTAADPRIAPDPRSDPRLLSW